MSHISRSGCTYLRASKFAKVSVSVNIMKMYRNQTDEYDELCPFNKKNCHCCNFLHTLNRKTPYLGRRRPSHLNHQYNHFIEYAVTLNVIIKFLFTSNKKFTFTSSVSGLSYVFRSTTKACPATAPIPTPRLIFSIGIALKTLPFGSSKTIQDQHAYLN